MDGIQRYIEGTDGRPADEIERADSVLGTLAIQVLSSGKVSYAYIYTADIAAGEGARLSLRVEGIGT